MTIGQAMQFLGMLITNTPWGKMRCEIQPFLEGYEPKRVAQEFARFVENGCRLGVSGPKVLNLQPGVFNPKEFLGKGWTTWLGPKEGKGLKGDEARDCREDNLTEIDLNEILFEICLEEGEGSITNEEKLSRLEASGNILLGGRTFLGLWQDYATKKKNSLLEWLCRNHGISLLYFFGLVLRESTYGRRHVMCLRRIDKDNWHWQWVLLDEESGTDDRSACLEI